jgi:hypothetical protein
VFSKGVQFLLSLFKRPKLLLESAVNPVKMLGSVLERAGKLILFLILKALILSLSNPLLQLPVSLSKPVLVEFIFSLEINKFLFLF